MYISYHTDFILTPLINILQEGILVNKSIGDGIESYPMGEYIMQALFLKMTGAQEQKMKCICWDMATLDYDYRYDYLNNKKYGEHSDIKAKNGIYKDLIASIKKRDGLFEVKSMLDNGFLTSILTKVNELYNESQFIVWQSREYVSYVEQYKQDIKQNQIGNESTVFESTLGEIYKDVVYRHRNRCAHNTLSYQQNKPDLAELSEKNYDKHNYFYRFTLLVLIDEIFIALFKKYLILHEDMG